jgi:hypothetical protein
MPYASRKPKGGDSADNAYDPARAIRAPIRRPRHPSTIHKTLTPSQAKNQVLSIRLQGNTMVTGAIENDERYALSSS